MSESLRQLQASQCFQRFNARILDQYGQPIYASDDIKVGDTVMIRKPRGSTKPVPINA